MRVGAEHVGRGAAVTALVRGQKAGSGGVVVLWCYGGRRGAYLLKLGVRGLYVGAWPVR